MQAERSHDEIRDANTRYHDAAAADYDLKWGIDFDEIGRAQVLGKVHKLLGTELDRGGFPRALEVGCGTGYFGLNLMRAGVLGELTCTDISPGMIRALSANASRLGLTNRVRGARADAESLPFSEASFDLVLGHAVLHHLPDLERAFGEFLRVLRPGGRALFAGEPSRVGDRLARIPKRAARIAAPAWRAMIGASPTAPRPAANAVAAAGISEHPDRRFEAQVDIHAFDPDELAALATAAGFEAVTVRGEELLANLFGWFNRGLEATVAPDRIPMAWRRYAFHGYLALQRLDRVALEPALPPRLFYNLLLTGRRP